MSLPWKGPIHILGGAGDVKNLELLLLDGWLDDEVIDMVLASFSQRTHCDRTLTTTVVIARCAIMQLMAAAIHQEHPRGTLQSFVELMHARQNAKVFLPVNLDQRHWVLFVVDLQARTVEYGESPMYQACINRLMLVPRRFAHRQQRWSVSQSS